MKTFYFTSILFLLNMNVFGQMDSAKINSIFLPTTITELASTLEKIKTDKSSTVGNVWINGEFNGRISTDVYYHQLNLSLIVPLKISGHDYWGQLSYILEILSQNDQIIFKRLLSNNGIVEKIEFRESQLHNFIATHEQTYNTKVDLNYTELKLYENEDFGVVCYFSGQLPTKGQEMMGLVNKNKIKELLNWVKAISPLTKAYGVLGLYILTKRGLKLKEEEKRLIDLAKKKSIKINTCVGCISGTKNSLNILLIDESLNEIYRSLK